MKNIPAEEKRIFGFKRNVFFLGLVSFFNDFSNEMVQSVMPVFLTVVLGAPAFAVGLIEGVADALASVLKLFSGWFSDKIHRRKAPAVWGYSLSVATRIFLTRVSTFGQVFGLRIIDRVGKGLRDAPRDALIVESVEKSELGKSFGLHRSMDTLGATLGPLLAFLVLSFFAGGYRKIFLIAFFLGIFAVFSFIFIKETKKKDSAPLKPPRLNWNLFREHKRFLSIIFSIFIFGLGTLPLGLVLLRSKEIGLGNIANIPLMYFVYSLTFVLVALPLGRLADKIGERFIIAGGFLAAIVAYLWLAYAGSVFSAVLCFIVLGLYSAATDGLQRVLVAKSIDPELMATGQGFLNMAVGFSSLGAGVVGGILWTNFSSSTALIYAASVSVIGLILFVYMTRKRVESININSGQSYIS